MSNFLFHQEKRIRPSSGYYREAASNRPAILFLHGLTGGPEDFATFRRPWEQDDWRIHIPVLPGHGTTPLAMRDLDASTLIKAVDTALRDLLRLQRGPVMVGGLSQGALLAILVASRYRIPAVVMAPPTALKASQVSALAFLRRVHLIQHFVHRKKGGSDISLPSERQVPWSYDRFPLPAVATLHTLIKNAEKSLPRLAGVPLFWAHGTHDHTAPRLPSKAWFDSLPEGGERCWFEAENSWHILTRDRDREAIAHAAFAFCQRHIDNKAQPSG